MSQKPGEGDMDEHTRILPPLQVEAQSACCVALDIQVNPEESLVIKARAGIIGFTLLSCVGLMCGRNGMIVSIRMYGLGSTA
jgi:hypothetical protein